MTCALCGQPRCEVERGHDRDGGDYLVCGALGFYYRVEKGIVIMVGETNKSLPRIPAWRRSISVPVRQTK